MIYLWICIFAIINCIVSQDAPERFLTRYAVLDKEGLFSIQWGVGEQEDIVFKIEARTLGYVALGFSNHESLFNTDVVIGWVANNSVYLQDRYVTGNRMPDLDDRQDWELISGYENSTHTTLVIRRKLNTCDIQDYALEYDNTVRLMYAYSFDDPIGEFIVPFNDLSKRGWQSFLLLQPKFPKETAEEIWDVMTSNFTVSSAWHTMYWCKLFKSPEKKYHITAFEPIILEGNVGHVHHLSWVACAGARPGEYDQYLDADGFDCHDPNSPSFVRECDGRDFVWGIGGEEIVLPDHIGLPIGAMYPYYVLQVHYDNVNRDTERQGRTGVRFHVTPHLRQHDTGTLMIGSVFGPNFVIPPGVKNFVLAGHTNYDCLGRAIPEEGVVIHSAKLHTHLTGTRVNTRHFRGNKELEPVADNKSYDVNFQQHHIVRKEKRLLPWDQITVDCTYDTSNKTKATFSGFSTQEEMCLSFLMYYPRVEGLFGSLSRVQKRTITKVIGSKHLISLTADQPGIEQTLLDYMEDFDWNRTAIRRFEHKQRFSEQDTVCLIGNGDVTTVQTKISYPENLQEYVEPESCSKASKERGNLN